MKNKNQREFIIIDKVLDVPYRNWRGQKFMVGAYETSYKGKKQTHVLLYTKPLTKLKQPLPLRINSACLTSDIFEGSERCDCKWQLDFAREYIHKTGNSMIIYSATDAGRGQGVTTKLRAYKIMDEKGVSTKEAFEMQGIHPDPRTYVAPALLLKDMGISKVELITNNPQKISDLQKERIAVVKRIPVVCRKNRAIIKYLLTKEKDFGHIISEVISKVLKEKKAGSSQL